MLLSKDGIDRVPEKPSEWAAVITELSTNRSFLTHGVAWEEVWDICTAPRLEGVVSLVDLCSVGLPSRLWGVIKAHILVLEEKSLVSEWARDNFWVQSYLSNFDLFGIGERIGKCRDLRLSDCKHIEEDCAYWKFSSFHLRIPGINRSMNDQTPHGCGWPEAKVEGELESWYRYSVFGEFAELCFSSSSDVRLPLMELSLDSYLV